MRIGPPEAPLAAGVALDAGHGVVRDQIGDFRRQLDGLSTARTGAMNDEAMPAADKRPVARLPHGALRPKSEGASSRAHAGSDHDRDEGAHPSEPTRVPAMRGADLEALEDPVLSHDPGEQPFAPMWSGPGPEVLDRPRDAVERTLTARVDGGADRMANAPLHGTTGARPVLALQLAKDGQPVGVKAGEPVGLAPSASHGASPPGNDAQAGIEHARHGPPRLPTTPAEPAMKDTGHAVAAAHPPDTAAAPHRALLARDAVSPSAWKSAVLAPGLDRGDAASGTVPAATPGRSPDAPTGPMAVSPERPPGPESHATRAAHTQAADAEDVAPTGIRTDGARPEPAASQTESRAFHVPLPLSDAGLNGVASVEASRVSHPREPAAGIGTQWRAANGYVDSNLLPSATMSRRVAEMCPAAAPARPHRAEFREFQPTGFGSDRAARPGPSRDGAWGSNRGDHSLAAARPPTEIASDSVQRFGSGTRGTDVGRPEGHFATWRADGMPVESGGALPTDPDKAVLALEGGGAIRHDLSSAGAGAQTASPSIPPSRIVDQIAPVLRLLPQGAAEITLMPEELGRVQLTLLPDGERLVLHVVAERPETLDLLRRHADLLHAALRDAGFSDVRQEFQQRHGQAATASQPRPEGHGHDPADGAASDTAVPAALRSGDGVDLRL